MGWAVMVERRSAKRYPLELPLRFALRGDPAASFGVTKNISSAGILFFAGAVPPQGQTIEYVITLNPRVQPVNVRCVGTVVRHGRAPVPAGPGRRGFWVAATLERYEFTVGVASADPFPAHPEFVARSLRPRRG